MEHACLLDAWGQSKLLLSNDIYLPLDDASTATGDVEVQNLKFSRSPLAIAFLSLAAGRHKSTCPRPRHVSPHRRLHRVVFLRASRTDSIRESGAGGAHRDCNARVETAVLLSPFPHTARVALHSAHICPHLPFRADGSRAAHPFRGQAGVAHVRTARRSRSTI